MTERMMGFAVCAMAWTTLCLSSFAVLAAIRLGAALEANDRLVGCLCQKNRALIGVLRDRDGRAA